MKALEVASLQFCTVIEQESQMPLALCDKLASRLLELQKILSRRKSSAVFRF